MILELKSHDTSQNGRWCHMTTPTNVDFWHMVTWLDKIITWYLTTWLTWLPFDSLEKKPNRSSLSWVEVAKRIKLIKTSLILQYC